MIRSLLFALALFLSGCNSLHERSQGNEASPYYEVPINSKFVLHSDLTIPSSKARVYFQGGRVLKFYDVNQYSPYCVLGLHSVKSTSQIIKAGEFTVQSVTQEFQFSRVGTIQVAGEGQSQAFEVLATVLKLHSESQPDIVSLTCARWGLVPSTSNPTIRDIRNTLGNTFTLELAKGNAS